MSKKLASGILPVAADTKKICLAWRSPLVNEGSRWGVIGGMVKANMSVKDGALLEMEEEVGYAGEIKLHKAHVFKRPNFEYHNFIGIVPKQFSFQPQPEFADETSFISWMPFLEIENLMEEYPGTFHNGLLVLFRESRDLIEGLLN